MFEKLKRLFAEKVPAVAEPPVHFGYKIDWLAFRTTDPQSVLRELQRLDRVLGKKEVVPCSWTYGVGRRRGVFVTPPARGWVLAHNYIPDEGFDELLRELSAALDTRVCHFGSMRGVSYAGYGLAERGELRRLYANADGETYWNIGEPTDAEKALGLRFWEELGDDTGDEESDAIFEAMPDEQTVDELAAAWSVNPNADDWCEGEPSIGWLIR